MDELRIESADGTPLRLCRWGEGPRDVLVVHGLAEHAGRYAHVAERLTRAGYRMTFLELRGHGQSGGKRGHVGHWRNYCEDLWAAARTLPGSYALVAHSMGGLVALDALREILRQPVLGIAVSNPLLGLAFKPPRVKEIAAKVLTRITPALSLKNELDPNLISRDPDVVRRYIADPLVFDTVTPRWATEMWEAQPRVQAAAAQMTLPLLLLVGASDGVCDPKASLRFGDAYGGPKQIRSYPALVHELFNEPEKEQVFDDLVAWLGGLAWDA